jgi:restriction endonuclease S subunit
MGRTAVVPDDAPRGVINQALLKLTVTEKILTPYLKLWMDSSNFQQSIENVAFGAAIRNVASVEVLKKMKVPMPSVEVQQKIVDEIETERALINANRELITTFEKKIQTVLNGIWGDDKPDNILE